MRLSSILSYLEARHPRPHGQGQSEGPRRHVPDARPDAGAHVLEGHPVHGQDAEVRHDGDEGDGCLSKGCKKEQVKQYLG